LPRYFFQEKRFVAVGQKSLCGKNAAMQKMQCRNAAISVVQKGKIAQFDFTVGPYPPP
jgi:hypothetical protein